MRDKRVFLPVLAGLAVSFIFGFSFLVTKGSLTRMDPFELLAHRFSVATVLLVGLIIFRAVPVKFRWRMFRDLLPVAFFQPVLYFIGETIGVQLTSASESALIISLIPVAVTILGSLFLKEPVRLKQWGFILLSVIGVVIIVIAGTKGNFGFHVPGFITLLIAVLAAAFYNILSRRFSREYSPVEITLVMMVIGAVFFNTVRLVTLPAKTFYFAAFSRIDTILPLLYLGILSSVVAFFMVNYMLKRMKVAKVATFINLTTVVSVVAGVLFRGEVFGIFQFIGSILILGGVWGITLQADENG